jgi:hypothetical protein
MIRLKIKFNQIDQTTLFQGKNGPMLDLVVWENKNGPGQYGDTHYVTQDLGKERREAGEKSPIIGNGKASGTVQPTRQPATATKTFMKPAQKPIETPADLDEAPLPF